jgi:alkanesulfonate monooxygenase SsuD/methylene tetrahydromethanopterin reductase-like flavin-dependent oxidoreductase (luciferase family)
MTYGGTFGVQFLPHHPGWDRLTSRELLRMADSAAASDVQHIWFSSRFLSRDTLTLMTAIAARAALNLGTMVHTPWGANPLQLAASLGTLAEILPDNREVLFGLGSGISQARWVERPRPAQFVRETFEVCRTLLAGNQVDFGRYPLVAEYFHLKPHAKMSVQFSRPEAVSFWFAPQGPLGIKLAAEVADGMFVEAGTRVGLAALRNGTLERDVQDVERLRVQAGITRPLRKAMALCMSLSRDRDGAYRRARVHAEEAASRPAFAVPADRELTDDMLRDMFVVGTPEEVADQLVPCLEDAERLGCEHISLGVPTGPDPIEAVELAAQVLVPLVKRRAATVIPSASEESHCGGEAGAKRNEIPRRSSSG